MIEFTPGEYYHVYNRGVDGRKIFLSDTDRQRFYESLYLFNDKNYERKHGDFLERIVQLSTAEAFHEDRERFVSIIAFNLMDNHFHIGLREERLEGVSEFMHRMSTGFTNFFNLLHERSGSLFQGPFQAVHVKSDSQLEHLVRYIHLNELDKYGIPWREGKVEDWDNCLRLIDKGTFSSHGLYCGRTQTLPVVDVQTATDIFPLSEEYLSFLRGWIHRSLFELPILPK